VMTYQSKDLCDRSKPFVFCPYSKQEMGFDEIDMGERGCDLRSSRSPPDIHLDPKLSLKSKIFVESLMPEVFRAMGLKRVRTGGYAQIVSCVLANLVKAGERSVIVRLGYHARYEEAWHRSNSFEPFQLWQIWAGSS
jgi:hypothetical protein